MGYVKHTVAHNLTFIACGSDMWEDVKLCICSDSGLLLLAGGGGRLIVLVGQKGSTCLMEWRSQRQVTTAISSGDAEAIERSLTMISVIRIREMLDPEIIGRTDNDSLRRVVERGISTKLGHLKKTTEENFNFLKMTQIPLEKKDTSENHADMFTKTLTSTKFLSPWYMFGVNRKFSISNSAEIVKRAKTAILWILTTSCLFCGRKENPGSSYNQRCHATEKSLKHAPRSRAQFFLWRST